MRYRVEELSFPTLRDKRKVRYPRRTQSQHVLSKKDIGLKLSEVKGGGNFLLSSLPTEMNERVP